MISSSHWRWMAEPVGPAVGQRISVMQFHLPAGALPDQLLQLIDAFLEREKLKGNGTG